MTQLSDQAIKEYQDIYFKEFGKKISKEEAREQGTRLVNLYKAVYITKQVPKPE